MAKKLIIVESPTKVKTLRKFLGSGYTVASSVGHIRDLPQKGFGIDVENDFEPDYELLPDKMDVIKKLKAEAEKSDMVILSPDPDREGEAIAWHIAAILPKGTAFKRVTFNAITKGAVKEALNHPREIDQNLVDAQQARRLLDRIVGYKISPILMRRVQGARDGGLSAGRVQSVALKLVVDREKEIEAFEPIEYWNLSAKLHSSKKQEPPFWASLYKVDGKRIERPSKGKTVNTVPDHKTADSLVERLKKSTYTISSVDKKEKKRSPVPPFITSNLQQEASRHYGFSSARTMNIAQSLYEGIELGKEDTEGLITYMRTDSIRVEPVAIEGARNFIKKEYGKEYLPNTGHQYAGKKGAQDAHEAIRPTNLVHPPETIKDHLSLDQYKLYLLIWRRFIASQMVPAIYDTVCCNIETNQGIVLRATGSTIKFLGFLAVYEEKHDTTEDDKPQKGNTDKLLPSLAEGQQLDLKQLSSEQAFTRPPPRFTEASLVKELERLGIGRPSTYAAIMNKIQSRDYTNKEKGALIPTELGKVIARMLEDNFQIIMDIGFTAAMEDELERIGEGNEPWKKLIREFWNHFIPSVEVAEKEAHVPKEETDLDCPKCGKKLQKIWSRRKYFYGCSRYPDCDYTAATDSIDFNKEDYSPSFNWDQKCPKCSSDMTLRFGRFGPFLGCSNYPDCKGIVNIPRKDELPQKEMPTCPAKECNGNMIQRRSRFGKPFFSCSNFPDCDVIINDLDKLDEKYPNHPKTPYVRKKKAAKKTSKKKTSSNQPKKKLSKDLASICGAEKLSRPEVIKKMWEYIKANNLQHPDNKRQIIPDAKIGKVIGKDPIDMMKLSGLIGPHLS
jgi:DNA topoisomerase-1